MNGFAVTRRTCVSFQVKTCPRETHELLSLVVLQMKRETRPPLSCPHTNICELGGEGGLVTAVAKDGESLRGNPRKPTLQTASESPDLPVFWELVAQALLDESSAVAICHAFELGGTIDALGDVAFVRDEIMVSFLLDDKLVRVVWHCLSFSWVGAKPPIAGFERRTSRDPSVAPARTWSQGTIGVFGFGFRTEACIPWSRATAFRCSFAWNHARTMSSSVGSAPCPTVWQPCGVACHLKHS